MSIRHKLERIGAFAIQITFWVAAIVVFGAAMSTKAIDDPLSAMLAIAVMAFIATLIHEIGHAWAAHKRGAQIHMIAALPFGYAPQRREFSIIKERQSGDLAGFVTYAFPDDRGTRRDEIAIAAAGPIWNFASAFLLALSLAASANFTDSSESTATANLVVSPNATLEPRTVAPTRIVPSKAEIEQYLEKQRAEQRAILIRALPESLVQILIVISIVSGILNLLPYRGSDGAIILEHWRWLRNLS